jgi:hypothetical protein
MSKAGHIAIIAAITLLAGCQQGAATPDKTVQQLMAQDVQPTAEIFWGAVGSSSELIDDKVVENNFAPQTDAEWQRVKDSATRIGELAELLKTPGYTEGRGKDWVQFASSLAEVAKQAEQAAADKNPEKVFEVGGTMYAVCSACHMVYPATTGPEAEAAAGEAAAN